MARKPESPEGFHCAGDRPGLRSHRESASSCSSALWLARHDVSSLLYLCLLESCHTRGRCACGPVSAGIPGEPLPAWAFCVRATRAL